MCRLVYKTDPAKKVQRKKNRNPLFFVSWTFTRGKSSSREWKRKKIWIFLKHKHLIFGYVVNSDNAILFSKKTRYIFHYSIYIISLELRFHLWWYLQWKWKLGRCRLACQEKLLRIYCCMSCCCEWTFVSQIFLMGKMYQIFFQDWELKFQGWFVYCVIIQS